MQDSQSRRFFFVNEAQTGADISPLTAVLSILTRVSSHPLELEGFNCSVLHPLALFVVPKGLQSPKIMHHSLLNCKKYVFNPEVASQFSSFVVEKAANSANNVEKLLRYSRPKSQAQRLKGRELLHV